MYKDIENYVNECNECPKTGRKIVQSINNIIRTTRPNELWEMDLIRRIKDPDGGNYFILVAVDHYTKWMEAKLLANKDAFSVCKAIKELILDKHGHPECILTDNGKEFRNSHIHELISKYKLSWLFNSPGHHKTTGLVERANQTLFTKIKKLSGFGKTDWKEVIGKAVYGYNISFNRTMHTSLIMIKYGIIPDLNIDRKLNKINRTVSVEEKMAKRDRK